MLVILGGYWMPTFFYGDIELTDCKQSLDKFRNKMLLLFTRKSHNTSIGKAHDNVNIAQLHH
jgi:hypothetical protein